MGSFLSKQQIDSDDYEKILSELDNEIQRLEIKLSDIKIKDRRIGVLWIIYSTLLWIIYVLYYLYTLNPRYRLQTMDYSFFNLTPIFLGPLCIYYIRKAFNWVYHKRLAHLDMELSTLRKKQKLKVEELKKKTSYYTTRLLLERFDSNFEEYSRKKEKESAAKQQQGIHIQPTDSQKLPQATLTPQHLQQQQGTHIRPKDSQKLSQATLTPQHLQQQQSTTKTGQQSSSGPVLAPKLLLTQQPHDQQPLIPENNNNQLAATPDYLHYYYQLNKQQPQKWYDKLIDALVGDIGPETKYALICIHCYAHNGLILPQEVDTIQYTCPHCHQFNPSRKSRKLHPDGPVLPPPSQPQLTVSSGDPVVDSQIISPTLSASSPTDRNTFHESTEVESIADSTSSILDNNESQEEKGSLDLTLTEKINQI